MTSHAPRCCHRVDLNIPHSEFPRCPQPQYCLSPMTLNFAVQMGCGAFAMVWTNDDTKNVSNFCPITLRTLVRMPGGTSTSAALFSCVREDYRPCWAVPTSLSVTSFFECLERDLSIQLTLSCQHNCNINENSCKSNKSKFDDGWSLSLREWWVYFHGLCWVWMRNETCNLIEITKNPNLELVLVSAPNSNPNH